MRIALVFVVVFLWPALTGASSLAARGVSELLSLPLPAEMTFCGTSVPLQRVEVAERLDLELVVTLGSPVRTTMWFKRAPRYFPGIVEELRRRGLPQDLKYVALVESNLRADAESWAGAMGPWQFMRKTGREVGLRQNASIDQRRDWYAATAAALDHLAALHDSFGSWPLALAAYNAGRRRVATAMEVQGESSYYDLRLPRETERYVFRVLAAKLVLEDPQRYGVRLEGARLYPPQNTAAVTVEVTRRQLPLQALARAADLPYRQLLALNPWLVGTSLPTGSYRLVVEAGREEAFLPELARWETEHPEPKQVYHRVRRGDTLSAIARKYQVRLSDVLAWNDLSRRSIIRPGQAIVIQTVD